MRYSTKKTIRTWIFSILLLGVLALQTFQVDKTNPKVNPPDKFSSIEKTKSNYARTLRAACYDCHSNETVYPMYTYVVPVGQWIKGHVVNGRKKVNFSTWGKYTQEERNEMLKESAEEIKEGHMPILFYTWLHKKAKLTDNNRKRLAEWLESLRK